MIWSCTGTRHGGTKYQIASVAWLWSRYGIDTLHNGDCVGADEQLFHLACAFGVNVTLHPPVNPEFRAFCSRYHYATEIRPPKGYHERDRDMVDAGEALVSVQLSSQEHKTGGTRYTTDYARSLNRPIAIVWPSGVISYENWTLERIG